VNGCELNQPPRSTAGTVSSSVRDRTDAWDAKRASPECTRVLRMFDTLAAADKDGALSAALVSLRRCRPPRRAPARKPLTPLRTQ
jgi:hypothetical protein